MPLSDHEQRLLDQIEQALYAEDPKFAANVRSVRSLRAKRRASRRWIPLTILGVVVGLVVVLVGLAIKVVAVGVVGFVLILVAVAYAARMMSLRAQRSSGGSGSPPAGPKKAPQGLRSRMEDRLRRRFDGN
jgi:hypothetical protein